MRPQTTFISRHESAQPIKEYTAETESKEVAKKSTRKKKTEWEKYKKSSLIFFFRCSALPLCVRDLWTDIVIKAALKKKKVRRKKRSKEELAGMEHNQGDLSTNLLPFLGCNASVVSLWLFFLQGLFKRVPFWLSFLVLLLLFKDFCRVLDCVLDCSWRWEKVSVGI